MSKPTLEPNMDERTRREFFSAMAMQGILSRQVELPAPATSRHRRVPLPMP
jgi:hypothetical protein